MKLFARRQSSYGSGESCPGPEAPPRAHSAAARESNHTGGEDAPWGSDQALQMASRDPITGNGRKFFCKYI